MASSSENSHDSGDCTKKKPKKRGITKMKCITRMKDSGKKYSLQWNSKNQPIGENRTKFMSYIGHCTRRRVSISYRSWHEVPEETKNMIAEQIMKAFEVPPTRANWIIRTASDRFREFKSRLGRDFMYKSEGKVRGEPPDVYDYIDQKSWTEFINQRLSANFQGLSKKNSETAKRNLYPYRGSRKGYAGIEQEMIQEEKLEPSTEIPRSKLWKRARLDIDGGIRTANVKEVADKIDDITEKVSTGQIKLSGRQDVLSLALGKDDHPGRVTGVGKGVTIKHYWRLPHNQSYSGESSQNAEFKEMKDEVKFLRNMLKLLAEKHNLNLSDLQAEENIEPVTEVSKEKGGVEDSFVKEAHMKENQVKGSSIKEAPMKENQVKDSSVKEVPMKENQVKDMPTAEQGHMVQTKSAVLSDSEPPNSVDLGGKWEKCQLFWPDLKCRVATGSMFIPSSNKQIFLHCKPLPVKYMKVTIDAYDKKHSSLPLPCPIGEAYILKEAVGIPIAWPKSLILPYKVSIPTNKVNKDISNKVAHRPQVHDGKQQQSLFKSLKKLSKLYQHLDSHRTVASITMGKEILGYNHNIAIWKENIATWIDENKIEALHVSVYMKYLFERKCLKSLDLFSFLCPQWTAATIESGLTLKERAKYICTSMVGQKSHRKLFFAPYNSQDHWMLAVVYPRENLVYWCDPLHGSVTEDCKQLIEMSIALFYHEINENSLRKNTQWLQVKCPRQPNTTDCGYYILRFMRDIVEQRSLSIPVQINWTK